jgi:hypothetical protein
MPMGVSAGIGAGLTGISAIAGLFGKKQQTVQQPTYTPEQQQLQSAVSGKLQDRLNNPADLTPLKTAAASNINKDFDSAQTSLEQRLAARGFGNSGKLVTNSKNLAVAKAGAQGGLESQFAALGLDQENKTLDMAGNFGFRAPGSTSTTTGGGGAQGAIGGAAETASLLYALNHFMNGGSGVNPAYAGNSLGDGTYGAGPALPPK